MTVEPIAPPEPRETLPRRPLGEALAPLGPLRTIRGGRGPGDPRGEILIGLIASALFFIGFGGWAAFARLDAAVHAQGVIVVAGQRQVVQHREGGTIRAIDVVDGSLVKQGQVLVELSGGEIVAREQSAFAQLAALEALKARLLAERSGAGVIAPPALFEGLAGARAVEAEAAMTAQAREMRTRAAALRSHEQVLVQRESQLVRQIEAYGRQRTSAIEQNALIVDEIDGVQVLADKGLSPLPRLRALQRQKSALEGQVGEYDALSARAEEQIGETRIQRTLLRQEQLAQIAEDLRVTEERIAELRPRYEELGAQMERLRIRAPASGLVVGLKVFTPGGVVPAGATIMEIVPQDRGLLIEAQIRPEDADDLAPNQRTEIKLLAYHQRELPILDGVVRQVSADRFVDERTGASFFKAELEVTEEALAIVEQAQGHVELRPGMPVEVVVPLRARTALEYALEPLSQSIWRSFREQ